MFYPRNICLYLLIFSLTCFKPIFNKPFFTDDPDGNAEGGGGEHAHQHQEDYGHMAKKLMNDIFDETEREYSKDKINGNKQQTNEDEASSDEKSFFE